MLPRSGDLIADRYRVDTVIGRGGMGVAYAATNVVTGKQIALKWIVRDDNGSRLQRVIREARAAGRIRHPNIVDVYDVGEHDGSLFLVMELLTGQSLQARIEQRGRLDPDELLRWLLPALHGVRAAHRRGVIHRDLKPGNIFLCCDDRGEPLSAKVLDFGVSKITAPDVGGDDPSLTDSGTVLGTPSYAAPEQLEQAQRADARADVYACGAILYHALSGRRPYEARSYAKLVVEIMTTTPVPLRKLCPDVPGQLCDVVERAMQRDLGQRFADMDALIRALEEHVSPNLASVTSHPRGGRPRRSRVGAGIVLAALVALISAAVGASWSDSAATETPARPVVARQAAPRSTPAAEPRPSPPRAATSGAATGAGELAPSAREVRTDRERTLRPRRSGGPLKRVVPGTTRTAGTPVGSLPPDAIIELSSDDF